MYIFLSVVYVLVCLFLILVVLLQQGKGGGMGGAFGGSSQTVFGGAGAGNVLTRATTASAATFMILSAVLAWMSSSRDAALEDVLREVEASNRSALIEAAEGSTHSTDEETDELAVPPIPELGGEDGVEGDVEGETDALEDPTTGMDALEGTEALGLELPALELDGAPVAPVAPTTGLGGSLRLAAPAAEPEAAEPEAAAEPEEEPAPEPAAPAAEEATAPTE